MHIRPLTLADYDAARRVWDAVDHLGPVPREEVERKLRRDAELFLVAEDDGGEVVGVVMGSSDGRRGWISRLAVLPSRQGHGIGRRLVEAVEDGLRRQGVLRLNLLVFADNTAGNGFWESLGYPATGPVVLRSKPLDPVTPDDPAGAC